VGDDVVDLDAPRRANLRTVRPAQAGAKADEDGSIADVPHGDVRDRDIFHQRAIDRLEGQAAAVFKYTVRDGDVAETAIGLGAALDAPSRAVAKDVLIATFPGAVEQSAFVEATDLAVGDRDVFRHPVIAEPVAALGADAVVVGRVDGAIGDANILAAVEVDAVAVGVDLEIVASPELQAIFAQKGITKPTISIKTALRWLEKLGWTYGKLQNGMYLDGHEQPDVVEYR